MPISPLHTWTLDPDEAARLQTRLRERLVLRWDDPPIVSVGGVDIGLGEDTARCAITVFRYPSLTPVEAVTAEVPLLFPYIPGLLAFREGPAILAAWEKLSHLPDLVLFDGQGIAHPRGMGIACLMGLWLSRPTVGVAKSRLFGRFTEPGPEPGDRSDLIHPHTGQPIGTVLRTRRGSKPLFISPGDRIDVPHAEAIVRRCLTGYRLPEPTR